MSRSCIVAESYTVWLISYKGGFHEFRYHLNFLSYTYFVITYVAV